MAYEIKGRVYKIGEVESISQSFAKQTLAIVQQRYDPETGEPYRPNYAEFEFVNDNIKHLQGLQEGSKVVVKFVVEGRTWQSEGRPEVIFTRLRGISVEAAAIPAGEPQGTGDGYGGDGDPLAGVPGSARLPWEG